MRTISQILCAVMSYLVLCLIGVQAQTACSDQSFSVASTPESSNLQIQLHRKSTSSDWKGCLTIANCVWKTENAKNDLPLEAGYTQKGRLTSGSPCGNVRISDSAKGGTIKSCSASSELTSTLKHMADLISKWKPSCSADAPTIEQVEIDGTKFLKLPIKFLKLPIKRAENCMTAFVRRSDGATAVVLSSELKCNKEADSGIKHAISVLDPSAPTVVAGTQDYSRFITLSMPAPAGSNPKAVGLPASKMDYLNKTWLPALDEIWTNAPGFVRVPDAPLSQEANTRFGFYLNYLTAAAMRLDWLARDQVAPDYIEDFDQVSSWMADIALSKGVDRRHSYFRAELLK